MKRIFLIMVVAMFMLAVSGRSAAAELGVVTEAPGDEYPHYLDMRILPFIENGITLCPVRALAEELGYTVTWDGGTEGIAISGNGKSIEMKLSDRQAIVNSVPITMAIAPRTINDRSIAPLRFLAESLGYSVSYSNLWDSSGQVFITPYTLINDSELSGINDGNFSKLSPDSEMNQFVQYELNKNGTTPAGIKLGSSIKDILQTYGVPYGPERSLNYGIDWSGQIIYWGSFIPQSDAGSFWEFTFDRGILTRMTVSI